jgi:poly [ADP-ribose] polymerase 10/14/15
MPLDPKTGTEKTLHMVQLSTSSSEYKTVSSSFESTMGITQLGKFNSIPGCGAGYHGILNIDRIQNTTLYRKYMAAKIEMDKNNPKGHPNERKLYHGAPSAAISKIYTQGFNRIFGFADGSVTRYGKGVYFARDATYSAQDGYSVPDANGHKRIFYARVLTGEYTIGNKSMLTPPAKNPANPDVLFDSTVDRMFNPVIYVVYNDAHCYPDYLITFH